jgi:hypothetical protein
LFFSSIADDNLSDSGGFVLCLSSLWASSKGHPVLQRKIFAVSTMRNYTTTRYTILSFTLLNRTSFTIILECINKLCDNRLTQLKYAILFTTTLCYTVPCYTTQYNPYSTMQI